jgi:hypothetical protein
MITIPTRASLQKQTAKYVMVQNEDQVYIRDHDEYLPKLYFSTQEAADILEKKLYEIQYICVKLGIQARANKKKRLRITLKQLRQMAEM